MPDAMKIYIEFIGCSRRRAEVAKLYEFFTRNGHVIVDGPDKADQIVLSTCAFKKEEEEYSLERVEALKGYGGKLLVYGCLPEIAPSKFQALSPTEWVSPKNFSELDGHFENTKFKLAEMQDVNVLPPPIIKVPIANALNRFVDRFQFSREFMARALGYVKRRVLLAGLAEADKFYLFVSKGCLGKCSYCAIRSSVGPLRSKSMVTIRQELEMGMNSGRRDIIVLGDDVGAYGLDAGSDFPSLLSTFIDNADGGIRFHIEEIHPKWLVTYKGRLMELFASGSVASLLCPIQSGNDRILGLMKREHDAKSIFDIMTSIRTRWPGIRLTTQIIAGFPTEREDEFEDTLQFLRDVPVDAVTIFAYDDKENAPSARIFPKIEEAVIRQRVERARKDLKRHGIEAFLRCPN
jgi:threonylcarbamoyladenosine tRNA methylthiotransferase CDKAL1